MMFNRYENPDGEKMGELRHYVVWRRRFLTSTFTLLLSCVLVYPFLAGHSLHEYWEPIGKNLILLSMVLLLVWGWCATVFYNAWLDLRTAEKGKSSSKPTLIWIRWRVIIAVSLVDLGTGCELLPGLLRL